MNASAPSAVIQQAIALDLLHPSPTNSRKRFNEAKLAELAESIKTQGVLQPILVRTSKTDDGKYEVIAGERRYRGSKLAGLIEVPCFVRELTDLQVLHAQMIENLQRDDLHPIEEAEGYEKLMEQLDDNGDKFTADTIAAEVGKSRSYVYGRLNLLKLCTEAREAFFEGKIESSIATDISRIPTQLLQIQALTSITEDDMSYRTAKDYIQRNFMLDLAAAPFAIKDAKLLAHAGACTTCIKRTGNQPELFDDVKSKDVCTDTACFAEKKSAHSEAIFTNAEANGDVVIRKEDAKKFIHYPGNYGIRYGLSQNNLAPLDAEIPEDAKERTWKEALETHGLLSGKKALHKTIIESPFGEDAIIAIDTRMAMGALTKAGFELAEEEAKQNNTNKKTADEHAKQQQEEATRLESEVTRQNAYRGRLFNTLREKVAADLTQGIVAEGLYCVIAQAVVSEWAGAWGDTQALLQYYLPDESINDDEDFEGEVSRLIAKMNAQQHFMIMIDCLMAHERKTSRWSLDEKPTFMLSIAQALNIDAEAIQQEAMAESASPSKKNSKPKKVPKA